MEVDPDAMGRHGREEPGRLPDSGWLLGLIGNGVSAFLVQKRIHAGLRRFFLAKGASKNKFSFFGYRWRIKERLISEIHYPTSVRNRDIIVGRALMLLQSVYLVIDTPCSHGCRGCYRVRVLDRKSVV